MEEVPETFEIQVDDVQYDEPDLPPEEPVSEISEISADDSETDIRIRRKPTYNRPLTHYEDVQERPTIKGKTASNDTPRQTKRHSSTITDHTQEDTIPFSPAKKPRIQHPASKSFSGVFGDARRRSTIPPTLNSIRDNLDSDESSDEEDLFTLTVYKVPKSQGGTTHINAIDIVCTALDKLFERQKIANSDLRPAVRRSLNQLQADVRSRLIGLVDLLDSNHILAQQLRGAKTERDALRERLLTLRDERLKVQQETEAVRQRHAKQTAKLSRVRELDHFLGDLEAAKHEAKRAFQLGSTIEDSTRRHETDSPGELLNNVMLNLDLLKPVIGPHGAMQTLEETVKRLEYLDQHLAFSS